MAVTRQEFDRVRTTVPPFAHISADDAEALYAQYCELAAALPVGASDFFRYRLFGRTIEEAADYLTRSSYAELCGRTNDPLVASHLVDKAAFNEEYQPYLGREYVVCREGQREKFLDLCDRNRRLVYKPRMGVYGLGASMISSNESYLWRDALIEEAVVEERIKQHVRLAALFPYSVNTVRLQTAVTPAGEPLVLAAALRCGRGRYVIDGGGSIVAPVDLATGRVCGPGSSRQCETFETHPDTGTAFEGFALPRWKALLELMAEAVELHPSLRLMSWDWACREDATWCLFEGNFSGGIGTLQEALGHGMKTQVYEALGLS